MEDKNGSAFIPKDQANRLNPLLGQVDSLANRGALVFLQAKEGDRKKWTTEAIGLIEGKGTKVLRLDLSGERTLGGFTTKMVDRLPPDLRSQLGELPDFSERKSFDPNQTNAGARVLVRLAAVLTGNEQHAVLVFENLDRAEVDFPERFFLALNTWKPLAGPDSVGNSALAEKGTGVLLTAGANPFNPELERKIRDKFVLIT